MYIINWTTFRMTVDIIVYTGVLLSMLEHTTSYQQFHCHTKNIGHAVIIIIQDNIWMHDEKRE